MFKLDAIREIVTTLKKNKLRTVLTGLSVSWGIFILIVLLGAGNGLKNGVQSNFAERAINMVRVWSGRTSIPHKGLKTNRFISFKEKQLKSISENLPETDKLSGIVNHQLDVSYKNEYGNYRIQGVSPSYSELFHLTFIPGNGRFVNELDMMNKNKVCVLDKRVSDILFKGESALGKYVKIGKVMFKVVGINTKNEEWGGSNVYIPFSTAQAIFNPRKDFYSLVFTVDGLKTEEEGDAFNNELRNVLAKDLSFDPQDKQAVWINNSQKDYIETMKIFGGITIFIFVIGIFTLIAGIVGVGNIMLVSVKERTREIGIRKAIGASPASIIKSVILESIIITTIFGYLGMILGMGLMEIISFLIDQSAGGGMTPFKDPTVNLSYVLAATAILIVSGIVAGYIPARRAVKIKPIEAMREN